MGVLFLFCFVLCRFLFLFVLSFVRFLFVGFICL